MCKYKPIDGSTYIKSPKRLERSLINVQNQDNNCFLWSVDAKLNPVKKNTERVSNYSIDKFKLDQVHAHVVEVYLRSTLLKCMKVKVIYFTETEFKF